MALEKEPRKPGEAGAEDKTVQLPGAGQDPHEAPTIPPPNQPGVRRVEAKFRPAEGDSAQGGAKKLADESLPEFGSYGVPSQSRAETAPGDGSEDSTVASDETGAGTESGDQPTRVLGSEETRPTRAGAPPVGSDAPPAGSDAPTRALEEDQRAREFSAAQKTPASGKPEGLIGRSIDGFYVEKLLGAGGMGAVYLAHQVSLDRKVALKTLPGKFANNPTLLARFTREALSAAQLNHHNVIQVYDVGNVGDVHYISMEYVRGLSLGDMIRREGRLTLDDAAGYILQACRGLAYAHQRGIIHRDIKPDNLMVNEHGVVKVADLGLAKLAGVEERPSGLETDRDAIIKDAINPELTRAQIAMGTPAYMAPEQARDTSKVDARADQYSLGCTLYYLAAGRAPYSGTTAFELMSAHMNEPLTPLDVHVKGVTPEFKAIIERMLSKNPEDRFPTLKEAAKALEEYLGLDSESGPYKPRESHVRILEDAQKQYYEAPSLKKRRFAAIGFAALMPVLFVIAVLAALPMVAAAVLGLYVLTPLAIFLINGIRQKNYLFLRTKNAVLGMGLKKWAITVLGTLLVLAVLWFTGLLIPWLVLAGVAAGLAVAWQMFVLRPLAVEREPAVTQVNALLKELRIKGVSEDVLQDFVARWSGRDWQEFYEEFFSYEDVLRQRQRFAAHDTIKRRRSFARWRDPLIRWLEKVEQQRRAERDRKRLEKVERDRLKSEGMSDADAQKAAAEEATKVLDEAEMLKQQEEQMERSRTRVKLPGLPINAFYRIFRFAAGLLWVGAGVQLLLRNAIGELPVLNAVAGVFSGLHGGFSPMGVPAGFWGIAAGLAVMLSAFTRGVFLSTLTVIGWLLVVGAKWLPQVMGQPPQNSYMILLAGAGLAGIGIAGIILGKLTGGK